MSRVKFYPALTLFVQYPAELEDRTKVSLDFLPATGADRLGVEIHAPPNFLNSKGIKSTRDLLTRFERDINREGKTLIRRTMHFPWLPYEDFNLGDLDAKKRAYTAKLLKKGAEYAAALDIRVVNTHLNATCTDRQWQDTFQKESIRQKTLQYAGETLNQVMPAYENLGITLAIENCPYPFESIDKTPPLSPYAGVIRGDFSYLFEHVQSEQLTYCYDALHANILATTAKAFIAGGYNISQYWGLYPAQEQEFRQIAQEGPLYQLRGFEAKTSHIHLGGQLGFYRPSQNTIIEGSALDLGDTSLVEPMRSAFQLIADRSRFSEISMVVEVKEEDYHHSRNLPPSLIACWQLIQEIP